MLSNLHPGSGVDRTIPRALAIIKTGITCAIPKHALIALQYLENSLQLLDKIRSV